MFNTCHLTPFHSSISDYDEQLKSSCYLINLSRRKTHLPYSRALSTVSAMSQLRGSTITAPRRPLPSFLFKTRPSILIVGSAAPSSHQSHSQSSPPVRFPGAVSLVPKQKHLRKPPKAASVLRRIFVGVVFTRQLVRHTPSSSRTGAMPAPLHPSSHSRQAASILCAMSAAFPPARSHLVATRMTSLLGTR